MKDIYLITDYKGFFGSKHNSKPYRSGMDKELLKNEFKKKDFKVNFLSFSEIDFSKYDFKDKFVLYTSSEDKGYYYKSYIEDIIYGLELQGARLIPKYKYLRANNNKVFMEIIRDISKVDNNIKSHYFGSSEELEKNIDNLRNKMVFKPSDGAMSEGVGLSKNKKDLLYKCKKISRTMNFFDEIWDWGRALKRKGYIKESKHRKKFIVQKFIEGLTNDWKVLIFNEKVWVLYRGIKKNDFRASGSGILEFKKKIPNKLLDFSWNIFSKLNIPNISLDIGFNNVNYFLLEFQALYFGSYTLDYSPFYFKRNKNKWEIIEEGSVLEQVYVDSIISFISINY